MIRSIIFQLFLIKLLLQTPGREFLLRVSYLEIYNEVITEHCLPNDVYIEHALVYFSLWWPIFDTDCCMHIVFCVCTYFQNIWFNGYMVVGSAWFQVINDLLDPTGQNLRVREDSQVSLYTLVLIDTLLLLFFHLFFYLLIMGLLLCFHWNRVYELLHDQWRCSLSENWSFNLSQSTAFIKIPSFMLK